DRLNQHADVLRIQRAFHLKNLNPTLKAHHQPLIRSFLTLPDPFTPRPPSRERLQQEPATTQRGKDSHHRLSAHSVPPSGPPTLPRYRGGSAHQPMKPQPHP